MKGYIYLKEGGYKRCVNVEHIVSIEQVGSDEFMGMVTVYLSNKLYFQTELSFDELLEMIEQAREVDNGYRKIVV